MNHNSSQDCFKTILGQKSCILGPTIFKIPQPNWHYWPYCAALFPHTSLYTMYIVHTILLPQKWYRKTKQKLIYFLSWLFCYKLLEYLSSLKKTQIKRHFHSKSAGDFFIAIPLKPHNFWLQGNSRSSWNTTKVWIL